MGGTSTSECGVHQRGTQGSVRVRRSVDSEEFGLRCQKSIVPLHITLEDRLHLLVEIVIVVTDDHWRGVIHGLQKGDNDFGSVNMCDG